MHNFMRAVALAARHKLALLGIIATSLGVALLWGANIGTVYPVVEVVFRQDYSVRQWLDEQLDHLESSRRDLQSGWDVYRHKRDASGGLTRGYYGVRLAAAAAFDGVYGSFLALGRWLEPRLPPDPFQSLVAMVVFLLAATVIKCLLLGLNLVLVAHVAQITTLELRNQVYRHMLQMELDAFGRGRTSDLVSRFTNDVNAITMGTWVLFGKTLREPLKMLVCLLGAALVSWQLLAVSLLIAPLAFLFVYFLAKSVKRANRRVMEEMAQIYNRLSESFTGIRIVKAYTMERVERSRFLQTARQLYHKSLKISLYDALIRTNNEVLGIAIIGLALVSGGYLVLNKATHLFGLQMSERPLSIPALMLFYGFLVGTSDPARKLADVFGFLQQAAAAADRVYQLLDQQPAIVDPPQPKQAPDGPCEIVFDRVTFGYLPQQPILRDVSLRVGAGERLAIVGPNGCGKSTLTSLVLRFYDPDQGAVRLNYTDLRELRLRDLRKKIGYVTQQTNLFDDTIANNIRYGSPHATDEQVVEAAKRAQAHRFIVEQLEQGYETRVGERGDRLSGGQRQRVALARAILRDPSILILDEATSQIDQESEQLIHRALESFLVGRTCLIITHRTSTLDLVDRILVLDDGRAVELGTHQELIARCPLYQRLYRTELKQSA